MSMTVGLGCEHWLQLRDGDDTREENLPGEGPWAFYPVDDDDEVCVTDLMTCLVCQTSQRVVSVTHKLVPLTSLGRPVS